MIQPHKKCCGCFCSLQIGCIVGCSLYILLFGMSIGSSFSGPGPDPVLAHSFCQACEPAAPPTPRRHPAPAPRAGAARSLDRLAALPRLARSVCQDLRPQVEDAYNRDAYNDYRDAYNDCYGTDVCVCKDEEGGDAPCDFTALQSRVNAANVMHLAVSILAEFVLVVAIVGAVKHRAASLRLAYRSVS